MKVAAFSLLAFSASAASANPFAVDGQGHRQLNDFAIIPEGCAASDDAFVTCTGNPPTSGSPRRDIEEFNVKFKQCVDDLCDYNYVSPNNCDDRVWYYACVQDPDHPMHTCPLGGGSLTQECCEAAYCGPPQWCKDIGNGQLWSDYWLLCRLRSPDPGHVACTQEICGDAPPDVFADPHFRTWHRIHEFDFQGGCDLVYVKAPAIGMNVHVRTTVRYDYSYITEAAISIGDDIFEVSSWGDFMLNGVDTPALPATVGGHLVSMKQVAKKNNQREFTINLGGEEQTAVVVKTFKEYLSVKVINGTLDMFHGASGVVGAFEDGTMKGRDGWSIINDPEEFAREWQVREIEDGHLFNTLREPQYPARCQAPKATAPQTLKGRRLSETDAEEACSHLTGASRGACIEDVLKTGDVGIAGAF